MNKELQKCVRDINKEYGIDTIHFGSDEKEWEKIPFGIPKIDDFLGGGISRGHFSVLWGGKGSGKTTACYNLIAEAQKLDKTVYYIDLENSFEPNRAKQFGVDLDKLLIGRFPIAEQSLDSILRFAKKKLVDVIILDSIHSLSPKGEQVDKKGDKSMEADTMALLARKLSQFFRMAVDPIKRANIAVLLIGQVRTSLGFISLDQLTGGHALKHYSVLTVHIRRGQKTDAPKQKYKEDGKSKTKIVGFDSVLKITKTQTPGTQPELSQIHVPYFFDTGFFEKEKPKRKKRKTK